jgi:hypothetical protein
MQHRSNLAITKALVQAGLEDAQDSIRASHAGVVRPAHEAYKPSLQHVARQAGDGQIAHCWDDMFLSEAAHIGERFCFSHAFEALE